ncbi:hypothetical protein Tco_0960721 [Tanacetum coccineum]
MPYSSFQVKDEVKYEHVSPKVTSTQDGVRSQDDDQRLCLINDLKEVQVHIQVKLKGTSSSLKSKDHYAYHKLKDKDSRPRAKTKTFIEYGCYCPKHKQYDYQPIGPAPDPETVDPDTIDKYYKTVNLEQEVESLMLSSMSPDLQRTLEKYNAYDMLKELKTMFEEQLNKNCLK